MKKKLLSVVLFWILLITAAPIAAQAQTPKPASSNKAEQTIDLGKTASSSKPLEIVVLLTLLSFLPAILISMTCFTRLIVVFHFLRQALGTQEAPNNQIIIGLSLFLTLFVMGPVFNQVNKEALQPMMAGEITQTEAISRAIVPFRSYMLKHTREHDLALFLRLSGSARPQTADDVPFTVLVPAFMISELKTAFQIGFILFI